MFIWRVPPIIYLTIFIWPILAIASALGLYSLFIGNIGHFDSHAIVTIPSVLWIALFAGPLGEELGWRGFLLPELQNKFSAITSSLIIGVIWYCWHIPLFFAPFGTLVSGAPLTFLPLVTYLIMIICLACLYTWMVNRSKGSVLIAILAHLFTNAGLGLLFFPQLSDDYKQLNLLSAPALVLLTLYLGMRTRFK
jgi:membrane protease YdiL (CAAX protease family)